MSGYRLASIHIYPMKAARAVDLDESLVEPCGLAGDRRWLLVDENGLIFDPILPSQLASSGMLGTAQTLVPVPSDDGYILKVRSNA